MRACLTISVFALPLGLWALGCSYTIDKSYACENEAYAEEGYGEDCEKGGCGNNSEAKVCFDEEYLGLDDLIDADMLLDAGADIGNGSADALAEIVAMVEPMLNKCTKGERCEDTGCALCYQCCDCKFTIGDVFAMSNRYSNLGKLLDEEILFKACVPSDIAEQLAMLCACPPGGGPPVNP